MMGEKAETPTHYEQAEKILDSTEVWSVADRMLAAVVHAGLAIADQLSDLVVMQKLPGFTAPAGTIANGLIRTFPTEDLLCRINIRALDEDLRRILRAEITSAAERCGVAECDVHIEIEASE